eukprot:gene16379-12984_t
MDYEEEEGEEGEEGGEAGGGEEEGRKGGEVREGGGVDADADRTFTDDRLRRERDAPPARRGGGAAPRRRTSSPPRAAAREPPGGRAARRPDGGGGVYIGWRVGDAVLMLLGGLDTRAPRPGTPRVVALHHESESPSDNAEHGHMRLREQWGFTSHEVREAYGVKGRAPSPPSAPRWLPGVILSFLPPHGMTGFAILRESTARAVGLRIGQRFYFDQGAHVRHSRPEPIIERREEPAASRRRRFY